MGFILLLVIDLQITITKSTGSNFTPFPIPWHLEQPMKYLKGGDGGRQEEVNNGEKIRDLHNFKPWIQSWLVCLLYYLVHCPLPWKNSQSPKESTVMTETCSQPNDLRLVKSSHCPYQGGLSHQNSGFRTWQCNNVVCVDSFVFKSYFDLLEALYFNRK